FDLWAVPPAGEADYDPRTQHRRAPLRCFDVTPAISSDVRYPTTELGFVWAALRVNDVRRALLATAACPFDLRVLGLLRAVVLLGAGLVVTLVFLARSPNA